MHFKATTPQFLRTDRFAKPATVSTWTYNNLDYQTGSGKTFTITGGAERYSDRGIIPRAIQYIFSEIAQRSDVQYKTYISFLEIYNG